MSMTADQIILEALALSNEERLQLVDRLVESLDPENDLLLKQQWITEATQRRNDVRTGKVQTISGPEALERVRKAVGR